MKKPEIVDGHLKKDIGIGCVTYRQKKLDCFKGKSKDTPGVYDKVLMKLLP